MPIPKPKSNERKLQFINRCMADEVMTNEYKIPSQRYAICTLSFEQTRSEEYQARKEKVKSKVQKIGFDYDGVASTDKGKELILQKIQEGADVWLISGTEPSETKYNIAEKLGVGKDKMIFVKPLDKWLYLDKNNFDTFYDNNKNQVDRINQNTNTHAILFEG